MKVRRSPIADKKTILTALRAAVAANGGKRISYDQFIAVSKLRPRDVWHHYTRWQQIFDDAGFDFSPYNAMIPPDVLLAEWGSVVRKLRRLPTLREFGIHGPREPNSLARRYKSWLRVPSAFRRFAARRNEWTDVLEIIKSQPEKNDWRQPSSRRRFIRKIQKSNARPLRGNRMNDRGEYGDLLSLTAMRHAPSCEQGVVYLFGILAERLGFSVEHMQEAFPDCSAKRRIARRGKWQSVAIEFEYESRNFSKHRHDPDGCDIIVCWEHNWPDCPKNIEVIALSEEIKRFGRKAVL